MVEDRVDVLQDGVRVGVQQVVGELSLLMADVAFAEHREEVGVDAVHHLLEARLVLAYHKIHELQELAVPFPGLDVADGVRPVR